MVAWAECRTVVATRHGSTSGSTRADTRYGPAVANQQVSDQWRRIIGGVLLALALVLVPAIVSAATQHRHGEGPATGRADCGSWTSPSELSQYRPAVNSSGCAQAIGDASRTMVLRGAAAVVLLVAGLSLVITARVTRWIWEVGLGAVIAVIYAAAQPGGLATPITWFFYGLLVLVAVMGLMRTRSRRARAESTEA